ncbi:ankyrin repeat domain-containing protein [archaeon]|nr:ankyrin repeat domain-containing protein [archaeon]
MNLRATSPQRIIRSLFSSVKRNDIKKFQHIYSENKWILNFKDNKRENILYYAFENDSRDIIDFVLLENAELLKEKNILNLNILHDLIKKNKNIEYFIEKIKVWPQEELIKLFNNTDPQGNNLLLVAAKSGDVSILSNVVNICPNFKLLQEHLNHYGQNIAHVIATNFIDDITPVIDILSPKLISQLDNLNGFSPLMLASYYQNELNFKSFLNLMPKNQNSFLDNNLMHFAAHNKNIEVTSLLLEKKMFSNSKNKLGQTPFYISMLKGHSEIAEKLFEEAKKSKIIEDEIVISPKMATKNRDLFFKIMENKSNEELSVESKGKFLEYLFLYSNFTDIISIYKEGRYSDFFQEENFSELFAKSLTGKKDMALKANFLLRNKKELTLDESITVCKSLDKLPTSQILFLLKKSQILENINTEYLSIFTALALSRGIDSKIITETPIYNDNDDIQKCIRSILKNNKIQSTTLHLENINKWVDLFKDKKIVWKHYGELISKENSPFVFLDNNFKLLNKSSKKELVFYLVTSMLINENEISKESLDLIKQYPNLLAHAYAGIVNFGKIPKNEQLIDVLNNIKGNFLNHQDLSVFLKRTIKKPEEAINLIEKTFNTFDFKSYKKGDDLCVSLMKNKYHEKIIETILEKLKENKDQFIYDYIDNYITEPEMEINIEVLEKLMLMHKDSKKIITEVFEIAILGEGFNNIKLIKLLGNHIENKPFQDLESIQYIFNAEKFDSCNKIQETYGVGLTFPLKDLCFDNINWNRVNTKIISLDEDDSFFEFISKNKELFTEKQLNSFFLGMLLEMKNNGLNLETIKKLFNSLDNELVKVDSEILLDLSSSILNRYKLSSEVEKYLNKDIFDNIFQIVSKNKNMKFFEKIQFDINFEIIPKESKIIINKDILDKNLKLKEGTKQQKKIKI